MPTLIAQLQGRNERTQCAAATTLGILGGPAAVDALIGALKADSPQLRATAAVALGWSRDGRALDALIAATKDTQVAVDTAAIKALGAYTDIASTARLHPLLTPLLANPNADIRAAAAQCFLSWKDHADLPLLLPLMQDPSGTGAPGGDCRAHRRPGRQSE